MGDPYHQCACPFSCVVCGFPDPHAPWVLKQLNVITFGFFWKGKRDLVSRSVVVQPYLFGGFSVINIRFKVWSLVSQWIKRFASSSSSWVSLMTFRFHAVFGATPLEVFSLPYSFNPKRLPPFIGRFSLPGVL